MIILATMICIRRGHSMRTWIQSGWSGILLLPFLKRVQVVGKAVHQTKEFETEIREGDVEREEVGIGRGRLLVLSRAGMFWNILIEPRFTARGVSIFFLSSSRNQATATLIYLDINIGIGAKSTHHHYIYIPPSRSMYCIDLPLFIRSRHPTFEYYLVPQLQQWVFFFVRWSWHMYRLSCMPDGLGPCRDRASVTLHGTKPSPDL